MCRLLGYCTSNAASLAEIMGERGLREFTHLSTFHGDGWGMAWYDGREPHVRKSPSRANDEPAYDELAHEPLGDLGLVHLRWATPGLPVEPRNTHPFRMGDIVMAHNGAIHPQSRLGELLPPAWERRRGGTTDSERYFLHVMSGLEEHDGDMIAALSDTAARIDRLFTANSLNAIFLTPDALYAVCCYDPDRIPHDTLATRGHVGPTDAYFDVAYLEKDDAVVVASSGWCQDGWTALPNRHVLMVDRATLRAKVMPLGAGRPDAGPLRVAALASACPG
ncbi:MAG TPA: class II glutamine amidotransferase [Streptosporangiaceae bacterium]|nr:class II glutamine amidotransferase [Streptosporangiaceae bacterium]